MNQLYILSALIPVIVLTGSIMGAVSYFIDIFTENTKLTSVSMFIFCICTIILVFDWMNLYNINQELLQNL